jgi:hypothetical protein
MRRPAIKFSGWFAWHRRKEVPVTSAPGIYLLAKFRSAPKGNADPLDQGIIYVGETTRSHSQRWYEFNNSAFNNKPGHSGGWSYVDRYNDSGRGLYVAVMPVTVTSLPDEGVRNMFIQYVERKILVDFTFRFGHPPPLNKK